MNLQKNLQLYDAGLADRNIAPRNIPTDKLISKLVIVKKVKTSIGDIQTFNGSVRLLDYMTQGPMSLNATIHVKDCAVTNRIAAFVEISPTSFEHAVWEQMGSVNKRFSAIDNAWFADCYQSKTSPFAGFSFKLYIGLHLICQKTHFFVTLVKPKIQNS